MPSPRLFALGSRTAGAFLVAAAAGYLALFVLSARRLLGADAALAWVPPLRLVVDVAKMQGFWRACFAAPDCDGLDNRNKGSQGNRPFRRSSSM